jgi:hypothetical protein
MRSIPGPEGGGVETGNNVLENSGDVFLNRSPGIDSKESIPPA